MRLVARKSTLPFKKNKRKERGKTRPTPAVLTVGGEEAEGRRSSSSFQKGVQLIKNRTGHTNNRQTRTRTHTHTQHPRHPPITTYCLQGEQRRTGSDYRQQRSHLCKPASLRFAALASCVCVRVWVCFCVCVGVHKYSHHAPIHISQMAQMYLLVHL